MQLLNRFNYFGTKYVSRRKKMKIVFLGTGAAEGVPAAYCGCDDCKGVRERGGREIKTRSSIRLGKYYQIDVTPDLYAQMLKHNLTMRDIEYVLITHTHGDHFSLTGITDKTMAKDTNNKPLHIYLSTPGAEFVRKIPELEGISEEQRNRKAELFRIHTLEYFGEYRIGDLEVETIKGNHTTNAENEYAINYLITTPEGHKLLYALDTGYYTDETWEYLRGRQVDVLIMDCTFAGRTDRGEYASGHLAIDSFLNMLDRMKQIGFINEKTRIYATHFNPHQGLTHDGIQEAFDNTPYKVTVARDGLELEL